jgi:hypothetical protein
MKQRELLFCIVLSAILGFYSMPVKQSRPSGRGISDQTITFD